VELRHPDEQSFVLVRSRDDHDHRQQFDQRKPTDLPHAGSCFPFGHTQLLLLEAARKLPEQDHFALVALRQQGFNSSNVRKSDRPADGGILKLVSGEVPAMMQSWGRTEPRRWTATILLGWLALAAGLPWGAISSAAEPAEPPIESIAAIKGRPPDAEKGPVARVRGVVTVLGNNALFIQDDTAGLLIRGDLAASAAEPAAIVPGAEVVATGTVGRGGFAPMLHLATLEVVGTQPLPRPIPVERGRFFTGGYDGMLVEIAGVFKGVRRQEHLLVLALESDGREFEARAIPPLIDRDLEPVVGAVVRLRGLALPVFNTRGGLVRPRIDIVARDGFTVTTPPAASPFACQKVPLASLGHYRPQPFDGQIVRIEGTVLHAAPGGTIHVQDGANGVVVKPQAAESVRPGDRIEAARSSSRLTRSWRSTRRRPTTARWRPPATTTAASSGLPATSSNRDPRPMAGCCSSAPAIRLSR
jgi:hypothetical protein